ncbi:MAG: TAT-variant-translocated molybdopterin oxidoreductase [Thermoanaerobaculia bacterium]
MRNPETERLDLDVIRRRIEEAGDGYSWRSLDEVAATEEFQEYLQYEFTEQQEIWSDPVSRRNFLKLMAGSFALAGLTGCIKFPADKIVPYIDQPEMLVPGQPLWFATAVPFRGFGRGAIVRSNEGRPTKIDGNRRHPATLGATDPFMQGELIAMYDPERAQSFRVDGRVTTAETFIDEMLLVLEREAARQGSGLRILTGTVTSPTIGAQLKAIQQKYPAARWHQWEPVNHDTEYRAVRTAFGGDYDLSYRFDRAKVILSLDSDFMFGHPGSIRFARDFSSTRRVIDETPAEMNRFYSVEVIPTVTGSVADHHLALQARDIQAFARDLAARLGVAGAARDASWMTRDRDEKEKWISALARELVANRGQSLVVAGEHQPEVVHLAAMAINQILGNFGETVVVLPPSAVQPVDHLQSLRELAADMAAGKVETLFIIGGNPVYDTPGDLEFSRLLEKVRTRVHLSLYENETSLKCNWLVPRKHFLEDWSDIRAFDGTISIIQPLIAPLYESRSPHELLSLIAHEPARTSHDIVKESWRTQSGSADFETFWETSLLHGVVDGTAHADTGLTPSVPTAALQPPATNRIGGLEVVFRPDPTVWDGEYAQNSWLQELPKPITKLTWDNAILISPSTADRFALQNEWVVKVRARGAEVAGAIWMVPGMPDDTVVLNLGYGRKTGHPEGAGGGFNAYLLRPSDSMLWVEGAEMVKGAGKYALASTQHHQTMQGRDMLRHATLEEYRRVPDFVRRPDKEPAPDETMYPPWPYDGYKWGMSIDLNTCIGCAACVIACQAENNIPVVGKKETVRNREMHWLRIDRYYTGILEKPKIYWEPVPCMHCENAPCEYVCPVGATVHSSDGLNQMIYNRCIGTRYCSNNCPYKVRRFNFLQYTPDDIPTYAMMANPNVTVRSRGVMEKCSYCVQRISAARIQAEKEMRRIRDGEVTTACQDACPTQAIVFGDLNDRSSKLRKLKALPRDYGILTELNTRPRTTYLGKIENPNPEIETE